MLIKSATSIKQIIGLILNSLTKNNEGRLSLVSTAKGKQVKTAFKVVEAKDLIVSNHLDGRVNPAYPVELQPRDRTRLASKNQINSIANNLNPVLLTDSGLSSHGAPIIGTDYVVESGNGRTMGILKAYQSGQGDNYKSFLTENSALFGIDKSVVKKMDQPVLVRVRQDDIDRVTFAKDSNISDLQSMSAAEQAAVDAERFNEVMVELFNPSDDGDLFSQSNMPFVKEYIRQIGDTEAAGLLTASGEPTRQLIDRLQNAVFSSAYQDKNLVKMVSEEADPEIRNVLKALNVSAPDFMTMRFLSKETHQNITESISGGMVAYGNAIGEDALQALTEAINIFREAKRSGQSITEYISQLDLFSGISEEAKAVALFIAANNRSAKKMGQAFKSLAQQINHELTHQGMAMGDLFGDSPATLVDILRNVSIKNQQPDFNDKLEMILSIPADGDLGAKFSKFGEVGSATSIGNNILVELKLGFSFDENVTLSDSDQSAITTVVPSVDAYKNDVYQVSDLKENIDTVMNFYNLK